MTERELKVKTVKNHLVAMFRKIYRESKISWEEMLIFMLTVRERIDTFVLEGKTYD